MTLSLLWHQQDNPASRGAKWPSDQAIPGLLSPWLAATALMAELSKLLSAFQVPFPSLPAKSEHHQDVNNLCRLQKPEVFLLFPPKRWWKTISVRQGAVAILYPFLLSLHTPPEYTLWGFIIYLRTEYHTKHILTLQAKAEGKGLLTTFSSPPRVRFRGSSHCQSVFVPQRHKVRPCMASFL